MSIQSLKEIIEAYQELSRVKEKYENLLYDFDPLEIADDVKRYLTSCGVPWSSVYGNETENGEVAETLLDCDEATFEVYFGYLDAYGEEEEGNFILRFDLDTLLAGPSRWEKIENLVAIYEAGADIIDINLTIPRCQFDSSV